jgi:LPS-assembly protein
VPVASHRSIIAFWLVLGLAPQAFAQDLCLIPAPPIELPPVTAEESDSDEPDVDEPLEIVTSRIDGVSNSEATFGEVEIRYGNATLTAQSAQIEQTGEVDLLGRVELMNPDVTVFGEDAHYDPDIEKVSFSAAGFDMPTRPARGSAQAIEVTSDSRVSLMSMLFTTCPPENVAWEISAKSAELDVNGGVGTARGVKLDFKGVPILYVPYFSFPINTERKSGFLTPDISDRDRTGLDLSIPYYLNLAPNYDLTL